MSGHPESLDHMLAAWNERDPGRIRGHLERALSPEVVFIDPSIVTRGIDEFEANVHEVHARLPDVEYLRASGVDQHHDVVRYAWEIRRGSEVVLPGFDVTELDASGRVLRVLGFFGPLPED
ncbi:MAG: nuclear transport factor 2 family protein [Myxococcota bacterium]